MGRVLTCGCGARLDASAFAPGQRFQCGSCGAVLVAPSGEAPVPRVEPITPSPASARRRSPDGPDGRGAAEKRNAHARLAASRLCVSSLYWAPAMLLGLFFLGVLGLAIGAVGAVVSGVAGLVRLRSVGLGAPPDTLPPGVLRSASRLARSRRPLAVIGIVVGVGGLVGAVLLVTVIADRLERDRKERREMMDLLRELREAAPTVEERLEEGEVQALEWLDARVAPHTPRPGEPSDDPLPEAELARRLLLFRERFGATDTVRELGPAGQDVEEPWPTWRRILREHGAVSSEAALPAAVDALAQALEAPSPAARRAAATALGEIGSGAASATDALTKALEDPDAGVQDAADEALARIAR